MSSSVPDPLEPPAPPEAVAAPPVSTEPAPSGQPRQRNKSPVVELVKIVIGGIAGCAIALVILWYGFGIDLLGLTSKSPKPPDALATAQKAKPDQPPSPAAPPAKAKPAESQVPDAETEMPALPDPFERPVAPPSKENKSEPDTAPKPETQIASLEPQKPDSTNGESEPVAESGPPLKPKAKASRSESFAVEVKRHSVPDEDKQKAIREQVKEIFKDEYQAATTSEKRLALAKALRNQAANVESDPAARFVVLREAYEHALAAGDHNLAEEIAGELAAAYDVDLLSVMAHLVTVAARTARSDDARREVVSRALEVVNQLADAKRFDEAGKVAAAVESLAIRIRDIELRKRLRSSIEQIEGQHREWLAVEQAMEKLKGDPNDPLANSIYGKHLCLSEGDWAKGLALLAKCKDAQLAAAAKLDIAGATEADKQLAIGDAWYDIARADESAEGFFARAHHWYNLAAPRLVGLDKIKAEKRLEELVAMQAKPQSPQAARDTIALQSHYLSRGVNDNVLFLDYENKSWKNDIRHQFQLRKVSNGYSVKCSSPGNEHKLIVFPRIDVSNYRMVTSLTIMSGSCGVAFRPHEFLPHGVNVGLLTALDKEPVFRPGEKYRVELWLERGRARCRVNGEFVTIRHDPECYGYFTFQISKEASIVVHELKFVAAPRPVGLDKIKAEGRLEELVALQAKPQSPQTVDLWDLKEHDLYTWNQRSVRENRSRVIDGEKHPRALLLLPRARSHGRVKYAINKQYSRFTGCVRVADSSYRIPSPLTFRIVGDGQEPWRSAPVQRRGKADAFDIDVSSVSELALYVDCPGSSEYCTAFYIDPVLTPVTP